MRNQHLLLIIIMLATICSTTSCATILIGSREKITFHSNLPGDIPAKLVVDGERIGNKVCFPITVSVRRGYNPSLATAEIEGYEASSVTIHKRFHPAILANLLIGGIIGGCVDLSTGAVSRADKKNYEFYFTKLSSEKRPISSTLNTDNNSNKIKPNDIVQEKTYKVGDLYSIADKTGIVVFVSEDGKHGKIISMHQAKRIWAKKIHFYTSDNYNSGRFNLKSIPSDANVPAIDWCIGLGSGWYLPAVNEMKFIYQNIDIINESLNKYGGTQILPNEMYWTSTESSKTEAIASHSSYHAFLNKSETMLIVAMAEF